MFPSKMYVRINCLAFSLKILKNCSFAHSDADIFILINYSFRIDTQTHTTNKENKKIKGNEFLDIIDET